MNFLAIADKWLKSVVLSDNLTPSVPNFYTGLMKI